MIHITNPTPNAKLPAITAAEVHRYGLRVLNEGKPKNALAFLRHAVDLKPEAPEYLHNLGVALSALTELDEAVPLFKKAVRLKPHWPEALCHLGVALGQQEKYAEGIVALRKAVKINPQSAELQGILGGLLSDNGQDDEAEAAIRKALEISPKSHLLHNNLGVVLQKALRFQEAIPCYRESLALCPGFPDAFNNLGSALVEIGLLDEGLAEIDCGLAIHPNYAEAHNNKARILSQQGDLLGGLACFDRALEINPDHAGIRLNRALLLLSLGDYERGLEEYEWRWKQPGKGMLKWPVPMWNGSDPRGQTIVLWNEQGAGDVIQYARYARVLIERGATVFIFSPAPLLRLLQSIPGVALVSSCSADFPELSWHAPLMSMPRLMGMRSLNEAPAPIPYIFADQAMSARCRKTVRADSPFVVGIAWRGNPKYPGDRIRSVRPEAFSPLASVPGVRVVSLLPPASPEDCRAAGAVDIGAAKWTDWADTAAAFQNLDLVITVDTAAAHLAGAMSIPVWIALPLAPDMRWGLDREDSPWYPTATLFRQQKRDQWGPVFERIAEELRRIVT